MSKWISKTLAACVGVTLLVTAVPSRAWIATEITQVMNNLELVKSVMKQIDTVKQLVETYKIVTGQLNQQVLAGLRIGSISLADAMAIRSQLASYEAALHTFGGDLNGLSNVFDTRMAESRILNISFSDYLKNETTKINNGNTEAKARVQREIAIMSQVQSDAALVQQYGQKISSTAGIHASTQLLNSQVNLMTQQLNKLVSMNAEARNRDIAKKMNEEAADHNQTLLFNQEVVNTQKKIDAANDDMIKSMPARAN